MVECSTSVITTNFEIKWTIKRFRLHVESPLKFLPITLHSAPALVTVAGDELALSMRIYVNNSYRYVTIELNGKSIERLPTSFRAITTCLVVMKNVGRSKISSKLHELWNTSDDRHKLWDSECSTLISRANIEDFNDNLTIECRIEKIDNVVTTIRDSPISKPNGKNLSSSFAQLFESEKFTDVTFVLGHKKLKAHKVICATCSPVFAAMFEHPMKERNLNQVKIDDIAYDVFRKMLRFIYTNEIDDFEKIAQDLLYAADKYELQELKEKCALSIWENITVNNATEALIFANRHNIKVLMESIKSFMGRHILDVIKTPEFQNMEKEHPQLAHNIYRTSLGVKEEK